MSKQKNNKNVVQDIFKQLKNPVKDIKFLPPPDLLQRFWHNFSLRVAIGVIFLSLLVVAIFSIIYFLTKPSSANLQSYVPVKTAIYLEFDLQSAEWQTLIAKAPLLTNRLNSFFIDHGLNQEIINNSSKLALVGLIENKKLEWTWLLKTANPRQLELFLMSDTFFRQLADQVVVISNNNESIRQFSYKHNKLTLTKQVDNLWSGFVRLQKLSGYFSQKPESDIKSRVIAKFLSDFSRTLDFQVKLSDNHLLIISSPLPDDFNIKDLNIAGTDLFINKLNFADSFNYLENIIANLPLSDFFWQEIKKDLIQNYELDYQNLLAILDKPAQIVIKLNSRSSSYLPFINESNSKLKFKDYSFIIDFKASFTNKEQEFIKDLIQRIVARNNPFEIEIDLPDKTKAVNLIAQPEKFSYTLFNNKPNSSYLSVPEGDIEIILLPGESNFLISNSIEMLKDYLINKPNTISCGIKTGESAYLSKNILKNISLLQDFTKAIISLDKFDLNVCLEF